MRNRLFKSVSFIVLAAALLLAAPVAFAQELTREAPTPMPEPTAEVTPEPTPPPVELPPDSVVFTGLGQLALTFLFIAFGGGGLAGIFYAFLADKRARDTAEKLYLGASPETQKQIQDMVSGFKELTAKLIDALEKSTDGQPN